MTSGRRKKLFLAINALLVVFVSVCVARTVSLEKNYRVEGVPLAASQEQILVNWDIAENCDPEGRTVVFEQKDRSLVATFAPGGIYSLEGNSLSVPLGDVSRGDSLQKVRGLLGQPNDKETLSTTRTAETYYQRNFLGVPSVVIQTSFENESLVKVEVISTLRTISLFFAT